jgi:hypothetical protein
MDATCDSFSAFNAQQLIHEGHVQVTSSCTVELYRAWCSVQIMLCPLLTLAYKSSVL